jgi:hypothetical protein
VESDFDDELDPDLPGPDGDDGPESDDWDDQPALTDDEPDDSLNEYAELDPDYDADPDDDGAVADEPFPDDDEPLAEDGPVAEAVGADPDLPDADWDPDPFPLPDLDLDELPEPAGGPPWIDASLLGAENTEPLEPAGSPEGARDDLAAADADPDASWDALRTTEDPAVRALARLWAPTDPEP